MQNTRQQQNQILMIFISDSPFNDFKVKSVHHFLMTNSVCRAFRTGDNAKKKLIKKNDENMPE